MQDLPQEILLKADNINLSKSGKVILDDICFTVNKHDFTTIVGPNGAGKSMLLKILIGVQSPTSGTVTHKEGLKIGYVPQRLVPDITMPITVKYFLKINKDLSVPHYNEIVEELSLKPLLRKQLNILSGGEMQRVLLARALLDKPDILILDEPAQNLDVMGQVFFYKYIEDIYRNKNISILIVSHDLHLVMASTKNVVCLYKHICCSGSPAKISKDPNFVNIFGSDLSKLVSFYNHHHDHCHDNVSHGHNDD